MFVFNFLYFHMGKSHLTFGVKSGSIHSFSHAVQKKNFVYLFGECALVPIVAWVLMMKGLEYSHSELLNNKALHRESPPNQGSIQSKVSASSSVWEIFPPKGIS